MSALSALTRVMTNSNNNWGTSRSWPIDGSQTALLFGSSGAGGCWIGRIQPNGSMAGITWGDPYTTTAPVEAHFDTTISPKGVLLGTNEMVLWLSDGLNMVAWSGSAFTRSGALAPAAITVPVTTPMPISDGIVKIDSSHFLIWSSAFPQNGPYAAFAAADHPAFMTTAKTSVQIVHWDGTAFTVSAQIDLPGICPYGQATYLRDGYVGFLRLYDRSSGTGYRTNSQNAMDVWHVDTTAGTLTQVGGTTSIEGEFAPEASPPVGSSYYDIPADEAYGVLPAYNDNLAASDGAGRVVVVYPFWNSWVTGQKDHLVARVLTVDSSGVVVVGDRVQLDTLGEWNVEVSWWPTSIPDVQEAGGVFYVAHFDVDPTTLGSTVTDHSGGSYTDNAAGGTAALATLSGTGTTLTATHLLAPVPNPKQTFSDNCFVLLTTTGAAGGSYGTYDPYTDSSYYHAATAMIVNTPDLEPAALLAAVRPGAHLQAHVTDFGGS